MRKRDKNALNMVLGIYAICFDRSYSTYFPDRNGNKKDLRQGRQQKGRIDYENEVERHTDVT